MAPPKRTQSRQPPSQADGSLYQSSVATPEIEVSLVDRMKRRFSSRDPESDRSASESGPDAASAAGSSRGARADGRPRRRSQTAAAAKRSSLGRRVTRIDKRFSPEPPSSQAFRSPTRFPGASPGREAPGAGSGADAAAGGLEDEQEQERGVPRDADGTEEGTSPGREDGQGASPQPLVAQPLEPSRVSSPSPRAAGSPSSASAGRGRHRHREPGKGGAPRGRAARESPSPAWKGPARRRESPAGDRSPPPARPKRQKTAERSRGIALMASGDVEAHMADKEFISSQVRALTTPFVLESGPRSWMQVWKGQQSSQDVDPLEVPASVINRIVTKVNLHMDDIYQRRLGRQRQRSSLMSLDELRKASQEESQKHVTPDPRQRASLQEVISNYPSEWSDGAEEGEKALAERYSHLRARLFALSQSVTVSRRQRDQLKSLEGSLQVIEHNVGQSSSADVQRELSRTADLVSQIKQKLAEGGAGRKQSSSQGEERANVEGAKHPPLLALDHSALVRALFKTALTSDTG